MILHPDEANTKTRLHQSRVVGHGQSRKLNNLSVNIVHGA